MKRLQLTLEAVTPLFLGGAQQEAELRPASIRGALRYWLRAALGGVVGQKNLDSLRDWEASVFGDTDNGSATVVRVLDHPVAGSVTELDQPGIGYLWFSMKGRGSANRQAFLASTSFRVVIQFFPASPRRNEKGEVGWLRVVVSASGGRDNVSRKRA